MMHTDTTTADREKRAAALMSLLAAAVLTVVKLGVGLSTQSLGILSEALHSGLDLLAAVITLAAVRMAALPADAGHAYGHGKIENLAALAETVLLLVTCVWIMTEVVNRLFFDARQVYPSLWGVGVMLLSIIIDVNRARMLSRVARKHKSQALEADALHFFSDICSSVVVLVGLLAVWCAQMLPRGMAIRHILENADTVAAFLVALLVLRACYRLARRSVNELLDGGSEELRQRIEHAVQSMPDVHAVRQVRVRSSGAVTFVDLVVCVDPRLRVEAGHAIAHSVEELIAGLVSNADVTVHVEPYAGDGTANPLVLIQNAAAAHGFPVHGLRLLARERGLRAELHAEFPPGMALATAHQRVTAFETAVRELLPDIEVVTHLEPEGRAAGAPSQAATDQDYAAVRTAIAAVLRDMPPVSGCHHLLVYHAREEGDGGMLSACFHCHMDGAFTVEQAHLASVRLESQLRQRLPQLGRIIVHMEPEDARA